MSSEIFNNVKRFTMDKVTRPGVSKKLMQSDSSFVGMTGSTLVSLLTTEDKTLTTHNSPLTTHHSPLTTHYITPFVLGK